MKRLAIVSTHPIQYYAPWFRYLAGQRAYGLRVFYLWDFGVRARNDEGFGHAVCWDLPLLDGYESEFVPNRSRRPGTHHFRGIDNPQLARRLRAFDADAVLCIGYNFLSFVRLLLTWDGRRAPMLLRGDSHRLVPRPGLKARAKRMLLTLAFRRYAAFLYVGRANREYYRLHGVPEHKLFFSPHAVDNDRFQQDPERALADAQTWKRELGILDGLRVVLFVGKFENKKRPLDLIAAFGRARLPQTALLLVGAGPLEERMRQQARDLGQVYFAPFQNQTQMPRTYAAGDLIVLPSDEYETWGLCINEAMCLGRPAVVSDQVGCGPDLIAPGRTGLIFPMGDVGALAESLRQALSDPERLCQWGQASRQRVREYSYARAAEGLEAALRVMWDNKPRG
jgi:glycosyltransferase involved in cell wall biosynthesis